MAGKLILFLMSIFICGVISYLLSILGTVGIHERRMKGFTGLCVMALLWVILNAVTVVVEPEFFEAAYTAKLILVCMVPFISFRFVLHFTESKMADSRLLMAVLFILPALDILALITNPLHKMYFSTFDFTIPHRGPIFNIHLAMDTFSLLFFYVIFFRYMIKNFRRYPFLFLTGVGTIIPYLLNMAYVFGFSGFDYDISPIGFFLTIILFAYFS